ncbi:MAG: hypothetical protein KC620_18205 [Myxococcales bacterium]|nr:hypothetical protein [Myxococcales bacterium]
MAIEEAGFDPETHPGTPTLRLGRRDGAPGRSGGRAVRRLLAPTLALFFAGPAAANPLDAFGFGARAMAMGSAATAISADSFANYYNPAGLAHAPHLRLDLGYALIRPSLRIGEGDQNVDDSRGFQGGVVLPGELFGRKVGFSIGLHLPDERVSRVRALPQRQPRWVLWDNRPQRVVISSSVGFEVIEGLSLGAEVVAMRRGGVIPHLEAVVTPGDTPLTVPETCPSCGATPQIEGDFVVCPNTLGCPAQSVGLLSHYAKVTGIEGFGQVWLDKLVEHEALRSPPDYYALTLDGLTRFERMGETLAQKLLDQIAATRTMPLATFLQALGVPDLGKTASRTVAEGFGTLDAVLAATPAELQQLPKFGELLAARVVAGLAERGPLIEALRQHVDVQAAEAPAERSGPWTGQSFLFTGTLVAMKREEAQQRVQALGGIAASGVSSALGFLVVGNAGKAGSKLAKAQKAGVTVLTEDEFIARLAEAEGA